MSIYQDIILDHYRSPRNYGRLISPTATFSLSNPLCGDEITIDVVFVAKTISKIRFSGQGCAISQASSSLLTDYCKGKAVNNLQKLDREFIINLLGIELSPNRIKCALLPLEVLSTIINKTYGSTKT